MTILVAHAITLVAYLLASVLYVRAGWGKDVGAVRHGRWFAAVGAAVHAITLCIALVTSGRPEFADSLSLVSLALMAIVLLGLRDRWLPLAGLLAPAAVALQAATFLVPSARVAALDTVDGFWWLPVHLGLVFAGVSSFFVEFGVSAIQLIIRRRLKQKRLGDLQRFPSLDTLDQMQFRSLVFGLGSLGAGIVAGVLWASTTMHHQSWVADPKLWFTVGLWTWYLGVLAARQRLGWHGRWSMWMSAVGFAGLLFSWVGLEFLSGGFHAYGG